MWKKENEEKFKTRIQEALNEEADKQLDKMNVERIEILVKLLNTYDKDIYTKDKPDSNEFKKEINPEKDTRLKNGDCEKKKRRRPNNKYLSYRVGRRFASVAVVLVVVLAVSNIAVKAYAEKAVMSWLTETKNSVIFKLNNTTGITSITIDGQSVVSDKKDNASTEEFEEMKISTAEVDFDDIDWSQIMKFQDVPQGFEADEMVEVTQIGDNHKTLNVMYKNPTEGGYISLFIQQLGGSVSCSNINVVNAKYSRTIVYENFSAYIYIGEKYNKALFASDGIIYSVTTTLDEETLCKMLENISYVREY